MKANPWATLIGIAALLVCIQLLAACGWDDQSLQRLQKNNIIRIGYAVEPPYAFRQNGIVTGEFPEVAKLLAPRLGIDKIEWVQTDFHLLLSDLEEGRFDVVAAGLLITPERSTQVAFSLPLLQVEQSLLVHHGNPKAIHSYQQALVAQNLRFAVIAGAAEETLLQQMGLLPMQIVVVPDARTGRTAVEAGLADGLALTAPTIRWLALHQQLQKLAIAEPFVQPDLALLPEWGYCAFAFRQEDQALLAAWNHLLRPFIASQAHLALMARFGFSPTELPSEPTDLESTSR